MRDLPIPGSPDNRTTCPSPALACPQRRRSSSISSSRPTTLPNCTMPKVAHVPLGGSDISEVCSLFLTNRRVLSRRRLGLTVLRRVQGRLELCLSVLDELARC